MSKSEIYWSLLFFFLFVSLLIFLQSSHFNVEEILFSDLLYFTEEEILSSVVVPFEENLFKIHRASLSWEIRSNPLVKRVEIRRSPPKAIYFVIEEQRPLAYIQQGGSMYLIGCLGEVMRVEEPPGYFSLPTIYGYSLLADDRAPPSIEKVLSVLDNLSPSFLENIHSVEILADRIALTLPFGVEVFVEENFAPKQGQILEAIYEDLDRGRMVDYIDARYGLHPVIKYVE